MTGTQGTFKFETGGAAPDGKPAKAQIRQYLQNAEVAITWFGVPLRYVHSPASYFERYKGRVNQALWDLPWQDYEPGELLYQNYTFREYAPVIGQIDIVPPPGFPGITFPDRLCDVTLRFLETRRSTDDTTAPANKNYVVGGHNLQPWWGDRKFHYGGQVATPSTNPKIPSFYSAPMQAMFMDPDFDTTNGAL